MLFEFDEGPFKALLKKKGMSYKRLAAELGLGANSVSSITLWAKNTRRCPAKYLTEIAKILDAKLEHFGHEEKDVKFCYGLNEIYDLYNSLNSKSLVAVASANGFKEVDDSDLQAWMFDLMKRGVEVRYYYPKADADHPSVRDYKRLYTIYLESARKSGCDLKLRGHQVNPDGRHLFGWNSRFVTIAHRGDTDDSIVVDHVFEYLIAGPPGTTHGPEEVWIRLETGMAAQYFAELTRYADPVDRIGVYEDRLGSAVQAGYRIQMANSDQRARYGRLREKIGTSTNLENLLEKGLNRWQQQRSGVSGFSLVRVLDIGTGDGHLLQKTVDRLAERLGIQAPEASPRHRPQGALQVTVVEPAYVQHESWAGIVGERATVRVSTPFEDYNAGLHEFDLIFAVHSFYLIDPSYLRKVYDLLRNDGMAIIILAPYTKNVLNAICACVDRTLLDGDRALAGAAYAGKTIAEDPLRVFAEDVADAAKRYFPPEAIVVEEMHQTLRLESFVSNKRITPLAWDAVSYFSNGIYGDSKNQPLQTRIAKACQELSVDGKVDNVEWGIVLMKADIHKALRSRFGRCIV